MGAVQHDSTRQLNIDTIFAAQHSVHFNDPGTDRTRWKEPTMALDEARCVTASVERIKHLIEEFERSIWYNGGLQQRVNDTSARGLSGSRDGVDLLTYVIAGRCMITFRNNTTGVELSVVTSDTEKPFQRRSPQESTKMGPMGLQSLSGTEADACELLRTMLAGMPEMKEDEKVMMV